MPIDAGVYAQQQPVKFNSPFENLSSMLQIRQQQQAVQSNQALEQERRAKMAEDAKTQAEQDAYKTTIQNSAGLTPDQFLEKVRTNAPGSFMVAQKSVQDGLDKAAQARQSTAAAESAHAQAMRHNQDFIGHAFDQIVQANGDPVITNVVLNGVAKEMPDWAPHVDALRQIAATQGKDAFLAAAKSMVPEDIAKSRTDTAATAAEIPGKTAVSQQQQQVLSGMNGGPLTAEQRATNAVAQQNAATSRGHLTEELRHNKAFEADGINADSPDAAAAADVLGRFLSDTGKMPAGFRVYGKDSAKFYMSVATAADKYAKGAGTTLAGNAASFSANQGSLNTQQKFYDSASAFLATADKNSALLEDSLKKIPDVRSPIFNKPLRAFAGSVQGDPNMAQMATYLTSVQNEYAKILTNPNLTGQLTDAARKDAQQLLSPDATVPQMLASIRALRSEGGNRLGSIGSQIATIKGRIQTPGAPAPTSGGAAVPAAAGGLTYQDYLNAKRTGGGG